MRRFSLIFPALLLVTLTSCTPQRVEPSAAQIRTATETRVVRVYFKLPRKYEMLGDIQTTEHLQYGPNKSVEPLINELIRQTAAKGGNGLLLAIDSPGGNGRYATYGGFYMGESVQFMVRMSPLPEAAMAQAIYVLEE